jgi:hypothetical protein
MSYERVCERCRCVCFSEDYFYNHPCFDMDHLIRSEIEVVKWEMAGGTLDAYERQMEDNERSGSK